MASEQQQQQPIVHSQFDFDNIVVGEAKITKTPYGTVNLFIPMKYSETGSNDDTCDIEIQPPRLTLANELVEWADKNSSKKSYYIDYSFTSESKPNKSKNFRNFVEQYENWCKNAIADHSEEWIGESLDRELIDRVFSSCVRNNTNSLRTKVPMKFNQIKFDFVDVNDFYVNPSQMESGMEVLPKFKTNGIWKFGDKWGSSWNTTFVKVFQDMKNDG